MKQHLVLVGGGHAHMQVMLNADAFLRSGHRVTLISPDPYHYYSGMGPGLLGGIYRPAQTCFHVRRMVTDRGGQFVEDRVVGIDAARQSLTLASGESLNYDVASLNVGSSVLLGPDFRADERTIPVKPISNLARARHMLLHESVDRPLRLAVVGGGPAGVEIAGNLARLLVDSRRNGAVSLFAGSRMLTQFPEAARRYVENNFQHRGIIIHEGVRVKAAAEGRLTLADGAVEQCDMVFLATGIRPPGFLQQTNVAVGADGGLLVNARLQSVSTPVLFGGGDCISFKPRPLAKVGVYAVRQNPVLLHNLKASLEGRPLREFVPQEHTLLIFNLGDGQAVLTRRTLVMNSHWPFLLKDWIDRRFMNRYQVSGETRNE